MSTTIEKEYMGTITGENLDKALDIMFPVGAGHTTANRVNAVRKEELRFINEQRFLYSNGYETALLAMDPKYVVCDEFGRLLNSPIWPVRQSSIWPHLAQPDFTECL